MSSKTAAKLNLSQCLAIVENDYRSKHCTSDYQPEEVDDRIIYLSARRSERLEDEALDQWEDCPEDYDPSVFVETVFTLETHDDLAIVAETETVKPTLRINIKFTKEPFMSQPTFKKLILSDLKAAGHHDIAAKIQSITYKSYSGGDSVRIKAINLWKSEREILQALAEDYKDQQFDGMTDTTHYLPNTKGKERRASYVFVDVEFTDSVREDVVAMLALEGIVDDETAKAARNRWFSNVVSCELLDLCGGLGNNQKTA